MTTEYFPVCCIAFPIGEEGLEYKGIDEDGYDKWVRVVILRPEEEEPKEETGKEIEHEIKQ